MSLAILPGQAVQFVEQLKRTCRGLQQGGVVLKQRVKSKFGERSTLLRTTPEPMLRHMARPQL